MATGIAATRTSRVPTWSSPVVILAGPRLWYVASLPILVLLVSLAWLATDRGEGLSLLDACLVASEPTDGGPDAPSNLVAELSPFPAGYKEADLSWQDNAAGDSCVVLERRRGTGEFTVFAVLPGGAVTSYHDAGGYEQGESVTYRVYAAAPTARSEYSNIDAVGFPILEPTPTPRKGDIDCDDDVDPADALMILRHSADLPVNLPPLCPALH
jgi:hypothetical protein